MTESSAPGQRLRRHERLRGRRNFSRVFALKASAPGSGLVVYAAPNALDHARFGVTVSRRLGNAVARARVRRILRELFRKNKNSIPSGFDYVCIPRPSSRGTWILDANGTIDLFNRAAGKTSKVMDSAPA